MAKLNCLRFRGRKIQLSFSCCTHSSMTLGKTQTICRGPRLTSQLEHSIAYMRVLPALAMAPGRACWTEALQPPHHLEGNVTSSLMSSTKATKIAAHSPCVKQRRTDVCQTVGEKRKFQKQDTCEQRIWASKNLAIQGPGWRIQSQDADRTCVGEAGPRGPVLRA